MTADSTVLPKLGNPDFEAWFTYFFLKNHIDPFAYPTKVGSREQVEFMVCPGPEERYYPCSDKMFTVIMNREYPAYLKQHYKAVLQKITSLVNDLIDDEYDRQFMLALLQTKYDDEIRTGVLLPSRLEKRLYQIFVARTHIENPYAARKKTANKKVQRFLDSETCQKALNEMDDTLHEINDLTLVTLREKIREVEFKRLLTLLAQKKPLTNKSSRLPSLTQVREMFNTPITGDGLELLLELMQKKKQKILWLADTSGEIMLDLAVIHFLTELNHIVILAVKEAPFFDQVCLADTHTDPSLAKELETAHFIHDKAISKNELVHSLKHDKNIYVISDGTRENLNLLLVSTTFSRIFKEVDCVVSRGRKQKEILIRSHFQFTQDIINISTENKKLVVMVKPRHPDVIKFSHSQLEEKAQAIIDDMKTAKAKGMTVMFYSGIIGSIPGKILLAKKIMSTFIENLMRQSSNLFIINPSRYYEPGMDADDLMYMWEIVQRSSYIDIWRFQTSDDIEESFALMNKKVPPEWIGKDATYSTGCTKEIRIAQDVLRANPEMQLIGPSIDKFMRRDEYGVGSMYDQRLAGV